MTSTESAAARDSPPGDRIQAGRANVALLRATSISSGAGGSLTGQFVVGRSCDVQRRADRGVVAGAISSHRTLAFCHCVRRNGHGQ